MEDFKFDSIEDALKDFKMGKLILVADDEDRENEGFELLWRKSHPRNNKFYGTRGKRAYLSCRCT